MIETRQKWTCYELTTGPRGGRRRGRKYVANTDDHKGYTFSAENAAMDAFRQWNAATEEAMDIEVVGSGTWRVVSLVTLHTRRLA